MRTIDADALIKAVGKLMPTKMPYDFNEDDNEIGSLLCEVKEIIDKQPTVNDWIPCSEQMPKIGEKVLIWYKKEIQIAELTNIDEGRWIGEKSLIERDDVTKWQPLPIPPKEEDND